MPATAEISDRFPSREDLVAYLDGELDEDASREIEELLRTNADVREEVLRLERAWDMLGELPKAEADEVFTQSTVGMAAVEAEKDIHAQRAAVPRRRRWQWAIIGVSLACAGFLGVLVGGLVWPDPDRSLLHDLPVLQNLDEYNQADNILFLRELQKEGLFVPDKAENETEPNSAGDSTP